MTRHFASSCALALTVISCLSAGAQAGPITFTYDWSPTTTAVGGDGLSNAIDFSPQGPLTVTTSSVVGNVASLSVQNGSSDTFTNASFTLGVKITDGSNSGTLGFNGLLNATVINGTVNSFTLSYTDPTTQPLTLGTDKFQVSITGYIPPSPYGVTDGLGCIGYQITVDPGLGGGDPNPVPEPASLLLSCIGVGAFLLRRFTALRRSVPSSPA